MKSGGFEFLCMASWDVLGVPIEAPRFSSTPIASARPQFAAYERNERVIARGDATALSSSSLKLTVVEIAKWRFLSLFLFQAFSGHRS